MKRLKLDCIAIIVLSFTPISCAENEAKKTKVEGLSLDAIQKKRVAPNLVALTMIFSDSNGTRFKNLDGSGIEPNKNIALIRHKKAMESGVLNTFSLGQFITKTPDKGIGFELKTSLDTIPRIEIQPTFPVNGMDFFKLTMDITQLTNQTPGSPYGGVDELVHDYWIVIYEEKAGKHIVSSIGVPILTSKSSSHVSEQILLEVPHNMAEILSGKTPSFGPVTDQSWFLFDMHKADSLKSVPELATFRTTFDNLDATGDYLEEMRSKIQSFRKPKIAELNKPLSKPLSP